MRKAMARTLSTVALLGALGACDRAPGETPERAPGEPLRYVALGDSYPAGGGPVGGVSFVDHYERLVQQQGTDISVTDLSVNGATTADLEMVLDEASNQAALRDAHMITDTIGGNDFLHEAPACRVRACYEGLLDRIQDRLDQVAGRIRELAPEAAVLMTNYPDPVAGNPRAVAVLGPGSMMMARDVFAKGADLVCNVAARHHIACVDVYAAFNGEDGQSSAYQRGLLSHDVIHPSAAGHRLIAQLLCDVTCGDG